MRGLIKHSKEMFGKCLPCCQPVQDRRDAIYGKLNEVIIALSTNGHATPGIEPTCEEQGDFWQAILKPWKCCADVHNSPSVAVPWLEVIRQHTSDLLKLATYDKALIDQRSATLAIYHKAVELAKEAKLSHEQRFQLCRQIIRTFYEKARECLESSPKDALRLLQCAYRLTAEHLLQELEVDENEPGFETFQRETDSLQAQVLQLRAQAYVLNKQAADVQIDVERVRLPQAPDDDSPSLHLAAMKALIQLDRSEQADAELLALVMHKDASAKLCLAALSAALKAPRCSALKPAADIVLQRCAEDAAVPLRLVQTLLGASKDKNTCEYVEALALEVVRSKKRLELFRKVDDSTKDQRMRMHALLWNHATLRIASKDYRTCLAFYTAALAYAEAEAKAAIACQLARAHVAVQKLERSLESPDVAAEHEPCSTESQTLLMQGEAREALDKLWPLMNRWMYSPDSLKVLLTEAETATAPAPELAVAETALRILWEDIIAVQIPSRKPGSDGAIVYFLINLMKGDERYELQRACAAAGGRASGSAPASVNEDDDADNDAEGNSQDSILRRLAAVFDQARKRLAAVGRDSFFGAMPPGLLARSAAPAAATASYAKDWLSAALMFWASGSFWDAVPTLTPQEEIMRVNAYVLGTRNALLEYGKQMHPRSASMLHVLHRKACAVMEAAAQLPVPPQDLEPYKRIMGTTVQLMLDIIERAEAGAGTEGRYKADMLIRIGYVCQRMPPAPLTTAAKAAWRAGLQLMRSQEEPPDMDLYAQAARDLYENTSEEEALTLLAETSDFVRSMDTPSYPPRQMEFLIRTAWGWGSEQAKARCYSKALCFMAAALSLMDYCDDYKNFKERYNKAFAKTLEKASQ